MSKEINKKIKSKILFLHFVPAFFLFSTKKILINDQIAHLLDRLFIYKKVFFYK
jgi:hypothetical protein